MSQNTSPGIVQAPTPEKKGDKEKPLSSEETTTYERVTTVVRRLHSRQRRIELLALSFTLLFIGAVAFAAWYSEGEIFNDALGLLRSVEGEKASRNVSVNCRNPKNQNTPYCQDRLADQDRTWSGITNNSRGKNPAFSLNKK